MSTLTPLFVAAALTAALLASLALWAPRRLLLRLTALVLAVSFLPLAYGAMAGLLSRPKPVALEWWRAATADATVLAAQIREGDGIYLWLQIEGMAEPRAYVLPWDRELAEELQEAMRSAERDRAGLAMRLPFEPSLDDREPRFYALPQPAMPDKDRTAPPPLHFQHPGQEA